MSKLQERDVLGPSAVDALNWMRSRLSGTSTVLFRGQSRIYPSIFPSLLRENVSEEDRLQWWAVLRRFVSNRNALTGYRIPSPHDAVAIVQHYLVKSPVLDVTGTPEIALYFAMKDPSSEGTRIVYAAEAAALEATGLHVTDHAFLALPFSDGGRRHRWLRQDGFTVGASDWANLSQARMLDFARLPKVESFTFRMRPEECRLVDELGDLETVEGDQLAAGVRGVFESFALQLGYFETVRRLMPVSGTIDAHRKLIVEIESLIQRGGALLVAKRDITRIKRLLDAASGGKWDTSWEAELDYWRKQVNGERRTDL